MTNKRRTAYIVSHTHWDREWYLTFHQFRTHLSATMKLVLDELERGGAFRHFVLDGQGAILDDHLEIHPEDRARIARLVASGGLSVGPWYVLPDEFLVSGEALVRNLIIGHRVCGAFGRVQKVGYVPDSFGHVAQLPQILRRAGIDSFIYMRGNGDEIADLGSEYLWRAPDGSEVLAVNQCGGYSNAAALGHAELWLAHTRREIDPTLAVERVGSLLDRAARESNANVFLLNNGSDHLPPQRDFGTILDALARAFPDTEFRHGSFEDYVAALRRARPPLKCFDGELLGGRLYHILSGVWSARMPLKQWNERAQTLLAGTLEPLASYAHFVLGDEYPQGFLEYAWRLLLKNHPHDSICGCSIDEVHREMLPRFAGVVETGERVLRNALERALPSFGRRAGDDADTAFLVANPLPEVRSEVVERLVVLQPPAPDTTRLALVDESGARTPFEILDATLAERFWGIDYRTEFSFEKGRETLASSLGVLDERKARRRSVGAGPTDCFLAIRFVARDLPPVGHAVYRLVEDPSADAGGAPTTDAGEGRVSVRGDILENERYEVRLHPDGTFDVLVKASGWRLQGLNRLEDTEDVGDEYDYSPLDASRTVTSGGRPGEVRALDVGALRGRLEAAFAFALPESIAHVRGRRSDGLVACDTIVRVGLTAGSPIIDVELEFDNRAKDHRLRAEFPTTIRTDALISDGHFNLSRRPIARDPHPDWVQPPPPTVPQQDFSLVEDGKRGLALLNRGLPEIEASAEASGAVRLSLTLLRAVGWLSRDDFPTRNYQNAGPTLATPEAQCLGRHRFHYALVPYAGDHLAADVKGLSQRYRVPVMTLQGVWDGHAAGGAGLVRKSTPFACVSAIKRHEERDTLVVRLYNLAGGNVEETLAFARPVARAWRVSLLEERLGELAVERGAPPDAPRSAGELRVTLGPFEIVTLEVEFGGGTPPADTRFPPR
jgi:mannosylglycerate hydrolase